MDVVIIGMLCKTINLLKSLGGTDKKDNKDMNTAENFLHKVGKKLSLSTRDDIIDLEEEYYTRIDDDEEDDIEYKYTKPTKKKYQTEATTVNDKPIRLRTDIDVHKAELFNNIDEFMAYVSARNLNVINTITGTKRTVKYLDPYNGDDGPTVMITFSDGARGVFAPGTYAKAV
jgi:hypothetical protein